MFIVIIHIIIMLVVDKMFDYLPSSGFALIY